MSPIDTDYAKPSQEWLRQIAEEDQSCVIEATENIKPINVYYQDKRKGAEPKMFIRRFVWKQLKKVANYLKPNFGLMIFDGFRKVETQLDLFNFIYDGIVKNNPTWSLKKVDQETRRYVAHPHDVSRFSIAPHNSGGAVDLAIYETRTGNPLEFGSAFDEVSEISRTNFFEQPYDSHYGFNKPAWEQIQENRRLLFHSMKQAGFVNYHEEWWHYDLGDCLWASVLGCDYVFGSMEALIPSCP